MTRKPFVFPLPSDGNGSLSLMKPPRTSNLRSGFVRLEPGRDVGLHSTVGNEEMIVVLEGRGALECEGCGNLDIAGGLVAYVPPHTCHNVVNRGTGPLAYIYVVTRSTAG
jgi:mannose-6-phosphate isomerase-like protein (cupin superfamily)